MMMMKRYWQNDRLSSLAGRSLGVALLLALFAFTACSSSDDEDDKKVEELTVQQLAGLWAADYAQDKTDGDLHWTRVVEDYLFRADGTGYYESYQMDGSKLVGAQSARGEGSFHYTISGGQQGKNTVTITDDKSNKTWTLTYVDGKLTDTAGTVLQKATTEQQTLVEQLNADWVGMNSGTIDDGSTIKTDVNDSYTDEPARARELLN
jgi:hypothetical protein